jgi:hypothetical protein
VVINAFAITVLLIKNEQQKEIVKIAINKKKLILLLTTLAGNNKLEILDEIFEILITLIGVIANM